MHHRKHRKLKINDHSSYPNVTEVPAIRIASPSCMLACFLLVLLLHSSKIYFNNFCFKNCEHVPFYLNSTKKSCNITFNLLIYLYFSTVCISACWAFRTNECNQSLRHFETLHVHFPMKGKISTGTHLLALLSVYRASQATVLNV